MYLGQDVTFFDMPSTLDTSATDTSSQAGPFGLGNAGSLVLVGALALLVFFSLKSPRRRVRHVRRRRRPASRGK